MNGLALTCILMKRLNRRLFQSAFCGLVGLLLVPVARATDPIYINGSPNYYTVPGNYPPNIDATAFWNKNTFSVSFNTYNPNPVLFDTANTLYYTNNSLMTANSPFTVNGFFFNTVSCGYQFDLNGDPGSLSAAFYNPGTIRCDSVVDGNNVLEFLNNSFFIQSSIGECLVSATNIINPGTVQVSLNGLIQLSGQALDLTRGKLVIEQSSLTNTTSGIVSLAGAYGVNTNADWDPGLELTAGSATSSDPYIFTLTNSTSYFHFNGLGTSNVLVRAIFIGNSVPNVTNQVYFEDTGIGGGFAHVEWDGTYVDSTTGQTRTNYLYLSNDYALGASTNVALINGIPNNFQFTEGGPLALGTPTAPGFSPVFYTGAITNPYSYADVQFIPSTVSTNISVGNPHGSLTNLPGRIQISASKELNLKLATISGANYLSVQSSNQFDGNVGAQISSAFSDINLGVTNGFLTVSNLLQSAIPMWNGTVQAWSTRWLQTDPVSGVTYDFRVLLVGSQIAPTSASVVQDLTLRGTNSLIISDVMNVMRNLSIDTKSLTLTTNGVGVGAASPEGELNWNYFAGNNVLGPNELSHLLWLTNNGAIRAPAAITFGNVAPNNYQAVVNRGLLSGQGMTVNAAYFENSGTITNGTGDFELNAQTAVLTNGSIFASGGAVSITAGSLLVSNLVLSASGSLSLQVTNLITDGGAGSGNTWTVGGTLLVGLNLPIKSTAGDLLGTTITNIAPDGDNVINTWGATDRGVSSAGYTNNVALGHLILDAVGPDSLFTFNGTGTNNALYVDCLELQDYATNYANQVVTALAINTNLVIYYAQAVIGGISVAEKLDGYNNNRLRWVGAYGGYFSSTNLVYPDGTTNAINSALAQSKSLDSDGDGTYNYYDPTPLFVASQVNFGLTLTNLSPLKVKLNWQTIPAATNMVYYTTNLTLPSANWQLLTNFISPATVPPAGGWPIVTNVFDSVNPAQQRFYKVKVVPNAVLYYGP